MSRRPALSAAVLAGLVVGSVGALARPAVAAPIELDYKVDLTTTVKKLGLTTHFPTGSFDGALDAGQITGDLTVPTATTRMSIGRLRLAEVKIRVIPRGPSTATYTSTGWVLHLTSRQEVDIQLVSVKALGLPLNLVGNRCKTATPVEQVLTGDMDLAGSGPGSFNDYTLSGTYTIPKFQNCGLLGTAVVNATIPGPDNEVSAHFYK